MVFDSHFVCLRSILHCISYFYPKFHDMFYSALEQFDMLLASETVEILIAVCIVISKESIGNSIIIFW